MPSSAAPAELRAAAFAAALAFVVGAASAQATSCSLTDYACVQQEYSLVCFDAERKLRLGPCLEWLAEIERSPSKDVRTAAAGIYLSIKDRTAPDAQAELVARSASLVHGVLEEGPKHADALMGLVNLAETNEERVRRLRDVVAVAPEPLKLEFLARAVDDGTHEGALEAAALYERAYEMALSRKTGDYALRFARNAIWVYEQAGVVERAERLRARAARDYGLPAMLDATASPTAVDGGRLDAMLQGLCREMTLALFGPKPCLDSIDRVVAAADRARAAREANRFAQTLSAAMITAARSGWRLDTVDSGWRRRFEVALERHAGTDAVSRLRRTPSVITVE